MSNIKPVNKTTFFQKIKRFFWKCFKWFFIISIALVVLFKWVPVPFTPLMITRYFENSFSGKENHFSHQWKSIDEISPNLQKAIISSEDAKFLDHYGFDFTAMKKAFKGNIKGKRLKGGSTISQQTAKNVFLWQGRSYIRKIFEAYFTVLIEIIWGKERIMEVYLNSIEMGDGVYGAQAATQYWYKKDCKSLTLNEAAGIAAILPNPRKYKAANSSGYINSRKATITRLMKSVGKLEY